MTRPRRALTMAARLAVLSATLCVLVATSPAPECDKWSAPVAFRAQGTCGPGGVVVVSVGEFSSYITLANGAALGLPPNATSNYTAGKCPMTLELGGWKVRLAQPTDASCTNDAGTTGGCGPTTCTVDETLVSPLRFKCTDASGAPLCESTLTVIE